MDERATSEYRRRNPAYAGCSISARTPRPNGGAWDLIGFGEGSRRLEIPGVGHHSIAGSCDFEGFGMYRFGYRSICDESCSYLTHEEGETLFALVKGGGDADSGITERLTEQGFFTRVSGGW